MTRFLLASGSPRRRELFALLGLPFEIVSADIDEAPREGETPDQMVARLAQTKAATIAAQFPESDNTATIILAADTTVSFNGLAVGKPADEPDAWRILQALRGQTHQVHTAITLLSTRTGQTLTEVATSDVPMRHYRDEEIAAYIASGDPFDKAGAYAIQHEGFHPVAEMRGCFANVMGLPLCHLTRMLRSLGVEPPADVPTVCQLHLQYQCPVYGHILAHQA